MLSIKSQVKEILERIPDDADWEDIMHEFYVRMKIEKGLSDIESGDTFSHSEVEKRFL